MLTILAVTLAAELLLAAVGEFHAALSRPSRRARVNLDFA